MKKIKVLQHCNQLGLGGTEKTLQIFCKYLDRDRFETHVLTRKNPAPPHRIFLDRLRAALGSSRARERLDRVRLSHCRAPGLESLLGPGRVHYYTLGSLPGILRGLSPQILHLHHSGSAEPPLTEPAAVRDVPVIFSTNVFGEEPAPPYREKLDRILFISSWLKESGAPWSKGDPRCGVLYYPVEKPCASADLRADLGIGRDLFVIGRVGRNADDIHDPISLRAYKEIESHRTLFLALSAPPVMKKQARDLGIRNIRWLDPSVDDVFLSRFYNTMDVMAHARLDGETFGCAVAEAMIHGRPVVTHRSHLRNSQMELVDRESGFAVEKDDWEGYARCLKRWIYDPNLKVRMGEAAKKRALENFEAGLITKKLEKMYAEELKKKGISLD